MSRDRAISHLTAKPIKAIPRLVFVTVLLTVSSGIRSNRKRDGNDDNRGEHWGAAHHPSCIANIG